MVSHASRFIREPQERSKVRHVGESQRKIAQKCAVLVTDFFRKQSQIVGVRCEPDEEAFGLDVVDADRRERRCLDDDALMHGLGPNQAIELAGDDELRREPALPQGRLEAPRRILGREHPQHRPPRIEQSRLGRMQPEQEDAVCGRRRFSAIPRRAPRRS